MKNSWKTLTPDPKRTQKNHRTFIRKSHMVQKTIIVPQQLPDCLAQFPIKLLHAEQRKNRKQFIYVANVTNGVLKVASKAQNMQTQSIWLKL